MNTKPLHITAQDALSLIASKARLPARSGPLLLLCIAATLLIGTALMLSGNQSPLREATPGSESAPLAPLIAGKTEAQLEMELARVNRELAQARAEREQTIKAIEKVSSELEQQLLKASLGPDQISAQVDAD